MRPPSLPLPFPPPSALVAGVVGWGHDWQRLKAIPIKWVRVAPFEGGGVASGDLGFQRKVQNAPDKNRHSEHRMKLERRVEDPSRLGAGLLWLSSSSQVNFNKVLSVLSLVLGGP